MGPLQIGDTHVKRSSGMSYAMLWKRENYRTVLMVALVSFLILFLFAFLLYGTAVKRVQLIVNGQESLVETKRWNLQKLLDDRNITVGAHDRTSIPLQGAIKDGDTIMVNHTTPVLLSADGKTEIRYTTGTTVADAIADLHLSLGKYDKVLPALDSPLAANAPIRIIRVNKVVEQKKETIPFEVVRKNDPSLLKGKEKVLQEGREGLKTITLEKTFEDGALKNVLVLDAVTKTESSDRIVAVGTRKPVTILSASSPNIQDVVKTGIKFSVKRVLNDVILTAYDSGVESTGKSKNHPQFGITYTGTRVQEGRTIAVDPNVIPLGWWVYIDGIGFRRAEDIGSGVKGKWIDIYYDSPAYADRFGMKRGATVYVIGPKKPESD
ncbi:G5 domain-containing protein [Ferviditalea candida]|uniref:G5 domain-containing protein n=1 Tax=Ferviditalea candida TaxID=3108399 RepID=A0ABU5ZIS5_9BACL|nr:G5 domain-containing protein [Paenibacillaceae bacterium T2]